MVIAVGLVRGINVGSAKSVSMADLAAAFEAVGFTDVKTLLRSGNVVFGAKSSPGKAESAAVERELLARTGVSASVLLVEAGAFTRIAEANPLLDVAKDDSKLVVTYLAEPPAMEALEVPAADSIAPEIVSVGSEAVYQWCPLGVSKSVVPASFWRVLGPGATARNWRTVQRILTEIGTRLER
ncbi:MAG: hypothetical protein QOF36_1437 [Microbacteriaceae bacterium]|jgi:uncharacterized protein (DUF1697 family)|nr:hypothetical protein [Microbacteriaceae bacterium]